MFDYNIAHHSWRRLYRFSVCAKLSYATDSRHTLAQTIHSPHEAWALLLSFVRCSAVQDRATVKTLKTIRSAHRVQRRSYFVFEAILRRPLMLENNLSNTMTNGDLCGVHQYLSRKFPSQGKENGRLYKCFRTQYFACPANIVLQLYHCSVNIIIYPVDVVTCV